MERRRIIISPLNWGFGHAGRMIPLARELQERGHEVIFAVDPGTRAMVEKELQGISIIESPGIHMYYSSFLPQYINILLRLPRIIIASIREHHELKKLNSEYVPDIIISDNRFGFYHKKVFSVYVTHMLRIPFPAPFRFLEFIGMWLQRKIIGRFDMCLIPDYPDQPDISGRLSHGIKLPPHTIFCGPLSRFSHIGPVLPPENITCPYQCLILSGPEPQSTILMKRVISATAGLNLVILSGKEISGIQNPDKRILVVTNPDTETMKKYILNCNMVICRSGYTTIMELLSLKKNAVLIPTPGQTEQEYLGRYLDNKNGFFSLKQKDIDNIKKYIDKCPGITGTGYPDGSPLFKKALGLLCEKDKQR